MKLLVGSIILVLVMCGASFAQKTNYRIRAKGRKLLVSYKGKAHPLNLVDEIDAAKITATDILFANRRNQFTYLVIDVSGQSKSRPDDHLCGGGTESNFVWVKLDSSWQIVDSSSVCYESCWSSTSIDNFKMKGNMMSVDVENLGSDINIKLSYNATTPEEGFQITPLHAEELNIFPDG